MNDVREINLISGIPAGRNVGGTSADTCKSAIIPDPGDSGATSNYFSQVFCDGSHIKAVRLHVTLHQGKAYVRAVKAFYKTSTSGVPETAASVDVGKLYRDKTSTTDVATSNTAEGYGVKDVHWVGPSIHTRIRST